MMYLNLTSPKKQTQSNPIKACPERSEFTLSVIEGNGPILEAMFVNFCAAGYYESKPTFAANNPNDARLSGQSSWRAHSSHDKSKVRGYNHEGV